jgi:hypothetical protein
MTSISTPAPRTPLFLDVTFRKNYARKDGRGTLKNISLTGAFLEVSEHDLKIEEKINLTFVVGSRERKITAQIIWKNSFGAGLKFLPVNNQDVQIVDDLIYYVESKRMGYRGVLDGIFKKVS